MREWSEKFAAAVVGMGVLAVTSRRWSAPLLASALGMGLFIGVAFGPALDGLGATTRQIVAMAPPPAPVAEPTAAATDSGGGSGSGGGGSGGTTTEPVASTPIAPPPVAPPPPATVPETPTNRGGNPGGGGGGGGNGQSFEGVVVHVNPNADSYTLSVHGELYAIHAKELPDAGEKVKVPFASLANGTYAEDGKRTSSGSTSSVSMNGYVTWVSTDRSQPAYTLSMRGASILVRVPGTAPELPSRGEFVEVGAGIAKSKSARATQPGRPGQGTAGATAAAADAATGAAAAAAGCSRQDPVKAVSPVATVTQKSIDASGKPYDYFDIAGGIQAVCPASGEILIGADDIREGGADVTVKVPKGFDLTLLEQDEPVLATTEVKAGELSLTGIASDDGAKGANDKSQLQGDFAGG